jgi:hypothetical protein
VAVQPEKSVREVTELFTKRIRQYTNKVNSSLKKKEDEISKFEKSASNDWRRFTKDIGRKNGINSEMNI